MTQLENIETIEKRLWASADNLRANSNYASNEYFMPVMGLIFLRHAYSRYSTVKETIESTPFQRVAVRHARSPRRTSRVKVPYFSNQ
ncbi:MAG: hypothetical protein J7J06_04260 [Methanosarcinales archaeon]|nr:hypothetical protein [Methanosarcinales archaeon]